MRTHIPLLLAGTLMIGAGPYDPVRPIPKPKRPRPRPNRTPNPPPKRMPSRKPGLSKPDGGRELVQPRAAKPCSRASTTRPSTCCDKAVAADKTKTSYRLRLARAYRYAGKDEQAIANLEEILKTAPDHVEAGQMLGELYTAAKRWKDVVRVLDPLLKYRHDYPTYHMLAEAQNNLGDRDKARKSYEEALKLNPQSASDHYQLGNIYLASNFFALAADSYHEALRLGLDSPVLRYKLGSAYFNLRNYFGNISVQTIKSGSPGTIDGPWYLIEAVPDQKDVFRCARRIRPSTRSPRPIADGIEDRPDIHVLRATIYLERPPLCPGLRDVHQDRPHGEGRQGALLLLLRPGGLRHRPVRPLSGTAGRGHPARSGGLQGDAAWTPIFRGRSVQPGRQPRQVHRVPRQGRGREPQTASLHLKLGNAYEEARKFDQAIEQWRMVLGHRARSSPADRSF